VDLYDEEQDSFLPNNEHKNSRYATTFSTLTYKNIYFISWSLVSPIHAQTEWFTNSMDVHSPADNGK